MSTSHFLLMGRSTSYSKRKQHYVTSIYAITNRLDHNDVHYINNHVNE
jgi:hypothetical protein